MNGNESAVGSIAYQTGYLLLILFLFFFIRYFIRLVKTRQIMMASGVVGYMLSLFLSESVLSITVVSVLLIFSQGLMLNNESKFAVNN
jgi:high-affinity Fe2+/Pb2+ permease